MQHKTYIFPLYVWLLLILYSCGTSNDVVSGRFIQKRKYTKGYHIAKKHTLSKQKRKHKQAVVDTDLDYTKSTEQPYQEVPDNGNFLAMEPTGTSHMYNALLSTATSTSSKQVSRTVTDYANASNNHSYRQLNPYSKEPLQTVEPHAKLGFILSLIGAVSLFIPLLNFIVVPILSIIGIIKSIKGLNIIQNNKPLYSGETLAITGIIISMLLLTLIILTLIVTASFLVALSNLFSP